MIILSFYFWNKTQFRQFWQSYGNYQQAFYAVDCSFQETQIAWIDVDYETVHGVGLFQQQVNFFCP